MKPAVGKRGSTAQGRQAHLKAVSGSGKSASSNSSKKKGFRLEKEKVLQIYDLMVHARKLEERQIKMYKQSDGYFWIGGPGEEALNIPLGLQVKKGEGKDFDYLHLHYRSSGIMLAMGIDPKDALRQMKNTKMDPYSGGRNFVNHFSIRKWNVAPVASTIETQFQTAIGTGLAQARHGGEGLTIVNGGDAGTAEGDFASCLIWASRPINPLPILMITVDNGYGISTPKGGQHGESLIADRAKAFNIRTVTINGNDMEEAYFAIQEAMDYVRKERKPFFLEAKCSRLYGHSSASGANFHTEEDDPIVLIEKKIEEAGFLTRAEMDEIHTRYEEELKKLALEVRQEPLPEGDTIYDHTYQGQKGRTW